MGLFRWEIHLGDYNGLCIADGYVYAESTEQAEAKLDEHYDNVYHYVVIDNDWNCFTDNDVNIELYNKAKQCHKKEFDDGVIVRWED